MTEVSAPLMTVAVLFVLTQIVSVITDITSIRRNTARTPPLDQEIYKDFATKAEVARLEGKMDALISSSNEALRDMTKSISELTGMVREHLRQH
jgi:hypothetical protein